MMKQGREDEEGKVKEGELQKADQTCFYLF